MNIIPFTPQWQGYVQSRPLLLFDLDGTLVDSAPDIAAAANHVFTHQLGQSFADDVIRQWIGKGAPNLMQRGFTEVGRACGDEDLAMALKRFVVYAKQHPFEHGALYPNVRETLAVLQNRGFIMAVVTNKTMSVTRAVLQASGLRDYFSLVVGGDSFAYRKPDPRPLLNAQQLLGLAQHRAIMVGDSSNDIVAAQGAGIPVICLSYGYNQGEDLAQFNADWSVDNFADILAVIAEDALARNSR